MHSYVTKHLTVFLARSDTEKLRMMDLLNTSLSRSTAAPYTAASIADPLLQGISSDVMCLKSEVMEAQLGVNKSKATTASMESRIRNIEKKVHVKNNVYTAKYMYMYMHVRTASARLQQLEYILH